MLLAHGVVYTPSRRPKALQILLPVSQDALTTRLWDVNIEIALPWMSTYFQAAPNFFFRVIWSLL